MTGHRPFKLSIRLPAGALASLALGLAAFAGCNRGSGRNEVSASLFLTPVADEKKPPPRGLTVLATELDFLQVKEPNKLPGQFEDEATETRVLAELEGEQVLVYESRSEALFSADLGLDFEDPDCAHNLNDRDADGQPDCERLRLHYSNEGFSEEVGTPQVMISTDVPALRLRNGWVIAFEFQTKSILAFRKEPPRTVVGDQGPVLLPYRSSRDVNSLNFGRGNGLLLSEVISGTRLEQATHLRTVARFFEIEPNKVLVFFSTGGAIHLLELEESAPVNVDFDLQNVDPLARDVLPVKFLRGNIKLFPRSGLGGNDRPFLIASDIAAVTASVDVQVSGFQPALVPTDGSALLFDRGSESFVRVLALHARDPFTGEVSPEIDGGVVRPAVLAVTVREVLERSFQPGGENKLAMGGSFPNPDTRRTEILIMEETTNNLLAYDYARPLGDNLRIFVTQGDIVSRRNPTPGGGGIPDTRDPELSFALSDIQDNRLGFDIGRDELVAFSYSANLVVVVLNPIDVTSITGEPIASLTYLRPLDDNTVRALDSASSTIFGLRLRYAAIPVTQGN